MTTKQELKGDWNTVLGTVKEKYAQITDDDLRHVEGNFEQLVGLIQRKTGQTREQVEAYLDSIGDQHSEHQGVTERVQEYAEQTGRAVQQGYEQVAQRTRQGYEQTADLVAHRPLESVVAALGFGFIAGLAVGLSMGSRNRPAPSWRERWTPS